MFRIKRGLRPLVGLALLAIVAFASGALMGCSGEESASEGGSSAGAVSYADSGFSSAEEAAKTYAKALSSERSATSLEELLEARFDMLDCWHPAVLDALLLESDCSDYEEFVIAEVYGSTTEAEALVDLYSRLYSGGVTFELAPGEALDGDDLEDIQDELDELGLGLEIESAYEITGSYTRTASDESESASTVGFTGTYLVEIGGSWYIWAEF